MYIENAVTTFEHINDPQNTVFLLNQYTNLENIFSEFKYFFGDKEMGIQPVSPIFESAKTIYMPFSELLQIASDDSQTILDLASVSRGVSELEARRMAFELCKGNRAKFAALRTQYNNSLLAQKLFGRNSIQHPSTFRARIVKNSNKYQQRAVKSEKIPINSNRERKNSEKIELKFCD